jgi:hypothetical protein
LADRFLITPNRLIKKFSKKSPGSACTRRQNAGLRPPA